MIVNLMIYTSAYKCFMIWNMGFWKVNNKLRIQDTNHNEKALVRILIESNKRLKREIEELKQKWYEKIILKINTRAKEYKPIPV